MSRVTLLHRIEKGEPSVAAGAWANAMAALGMKLLARNDEDADATGASPQPKELADRIPVRVRLADDPQLKAMVWQVHGTDTLTPVEAPGIYERHARHLDTAVMSPAEQALLAACLAAAPASPCATANTASRWASISCCLTPRATANRGSCSRASRASKPGFGQALNRWWCGARCGRSVRPAHGAADACSAAT